MKKKAIIQSYREWRELNENRMPNRVSVRVKWDDTQEEYNYIISLRQYREGNAHDELADDRIFFYANVSELHKLTKPNNGNDFHITKIYKWYKE